MAYKNRHCGLHATDVDKAFAGVPALSRVTFDAKPGEIVAITGPSGAGKTTTCRIITGLTAPDAGALELNNRSLIDVPPHGRCISMMFESYALYPQMNVRENVAFPLRAPMREKRYDETAISKRIDELFELTELSHLRARMPSELSGGQKQRVALCRALVQEPSLFVFDEPISHLDAKLRHRLRGALRQRLIARDVPAIWCTPDGVEALSIADRVAVLIAGELKQFDTPEVIFAQPSDIQVARLIGDPAMNLLRGSLIARKNTLCFQHQAMTIRLPEKIRARLEAGKVRSEIVLGIRAADIEIASRAGVNVGTGEVYTVEPFGKYTIVTVKLGADTVKAKISGSLDLDGGGIVPIRFSGKDCSVFDTSTGRAI